MFEGLENITDKIGDVVGNVADHVDVSYPDRDAVTADDNNEDDIEDKLPDEGCIRGPEEEDDPTPQWGADAPLSVDFRGAINFTARALRWAVDGRFKPDGKIHVEWNGTEDTDAKHTERAEQLRKLQERQQRKDGQSARFE